MANNFCSNCGEPISEPDANVCTNCGKPLRQPQTEPTTNESYQNTTGGSFQQSGSSNAQQSGSGDAQQTGSSNAQQSGSGDAQQTGSSNAQQTWNSDAHQTGNGDAHDTGSEQHARNENKNTYTRPENVVYPKEKNPIVSVILSFLFPGAGQVYNGNLKKGLMIVAGAIITLFIFFPASFVVWIYNLYDAYTDADKMNKGQIPYAEATTQDVLIYAGAFIGLFIVLFIIFFIIGLLFGALMFF